MSPDMPRQTPSSSSLFRAARRLATRGSLSVCSGVLLLAALLALGLGGCGEEDDCPVCPTSSILIEEIFVLPESVAMGGTVEFWALPYDAAQTYFWSASAGRFTLTDENYAQWKAPETPSIARVTVAINRGEESGAMSVPIAVETYLPRHTPTYTGAGYCGLECHNVAGHGEHYESWLATSHATAFAGAAAHGAYTPDCAACHAVGYGDVDSLGRMRHNGGFDELPITRLEGVQCESCHGPLADRYGEILGDHGERALAAGLLRLGTPAQPQGCARCHESYAAEAHAQGAAYLTEWLASGHAEIPAGVDLEDLTCIGCHTAQGFIARLAPGGGLSEVPGAPLALTCAACHDPHGSAHPADLRAGSNVDPCSQCHTDLSGGYPDAPHAPQADLLAGRGGYEYEGAVFPSTPHANVVTNPQLERRGCAHCHYPAGASQDGGHTFGPDPASCAACHPEASGVDLEWTTAQAEVRGLLNELAAELAAATTADSLTTAFAQARFNWQVVTADGSAGAHNFDYAKALLEESLARFTPGAKR